MDTLTHIVIGAAAGEIIVGDKMKKKALLYGALIQLLPDVDGIAAIYLSPVDNLWAHRGITHSFFFIFLCALPIALLLYRFYREKGYSLSYLYFFAFIELLFHLCIDVFNNYGIGWLEPFSSKRFSLDVLYVIDPFLTLLPMILFIVLLVSKIKKPRNKILASASLLYVFMYIGYAFYNKKAVEHLVLKSYNKSQLGKRLLTTPAPFQTWLWFVSVEQDSSYLVAYHSVFSNNPVKWYSVKKNYFLQDSISDAATLDKLKRFSRNYWTLEKKNGTVIFNNLRFGQQAGWYKPYAPFAFHYYLNSKDNLFVLQRGRFAGINKQSMASFISRIKGY